MAFRALVVLSALTIALSAFADSWLPPKPMAAVSKNAQWVVRVTPRVSDIPATARLYEFDAEEGAFILSSEFALENQVAPAELFVSNSGNLIGLDNWGGLGRGEVLTIYTQSGGRLHRYNLRDFFDSSERKSLQRSVSSIHWRCRTSELNENIRSLLIWDGVGRVVAVNYKTGKIRVRDKHEECEGY